MGGDRLPPKSSVEDAKRKRVQLYRAASERGCPLPDDEKSVHIIESVFAFGEFVSGNCIRHPEMLADLLQSGDLQRTYPPDRYHSLVSNAIPPLSCIPANDEPAVAEIQRSLRFLRRREMVRIAIRDLAGWAGLAETMTDLSAFADACLEQTQKILHEMLCRQYGSPETAGGGPQRLVILAMGKLGAGELNFSSDVDLIFAYPDEGKTAGGQTVTDNAQFFTRLCRQIVRVLGQKTEDGQVFRVDLGLRPFGESGPIALNFDAMESYYQTQGREWERYALIKARAAAGDRSAGERLLERLRPFVYRRYLDYGVFESLREMKRKINREAAKKGMSGNIKLGKGGIREIEFFGQVFQLIRGGVIPELRQRGIQEVLGFLQKERYVPESVCKELLSAYRFLRRTENRLQAFSDRQTHELPEEKRPRQQLAGSMGFVSWDAFSSRLAHCMDTVHGHFSRLLESTDSLQAVPRHDDRLLEVWKGRQAFSDQNRHLTGAGYKKPETVVRMLENLRTATATRALSAEGRKRLDLLMPMVIQAAGKAEKPESALNGIVDLIKAVEQRTNYLSLLGENPATLSQLVKFADASPWIVSFMAKHPVLLDELLDTRTLFTPMEKADLEKEIGKRAASVPEGDLEDFIEALCIFKQISTLRVAAADVAGILPLMKVSDRLSWIAETILDQVMAFAWRDLVKRHGRPTCAADPNGRHRCFAVVAYGKLGGLELGYDSDLDLVFLHAGGKGLTRDGSHPIDSGQFFARLGQKMVHILTAHTRAGRLYSTDMRLRPSGSSGPLVSQIDAFRDYQILDARTWENQAIVRARAVCGDPELVRRFEEIRKEILARPRPGHALQKDVVEMRERLRWESHRPETGVFHLKQDLGAMVDIEFLAQYLVLLKAHAHAEVTRWSDNVRILESLTETGVIDNETAYRLKQAYLTYRATAHRLSLREKPPKVPVSQFQPLQEAVRSAWQRFLGTGSSS